MNSASEGGTVIPSGDAGDNTPGALLRQERERRGLSVQQAAEDLHLDPWIIEALEANRFLALGAPVYAKGHLRKYAILVGLSPEDVIARYLALSDTPAVPTPIPATTAAPLPRHRPSFALPLGILAAVLIVVALWSVMNEPPQDEPVAAVVPAAVESPTAVPVAVAPELQARQDASATVRPATPQVAPPVALAPREPGKPASQPAPAPVVSAAPVASGDTVQLRVSFSDASWAEIYDANGERLMFDIGQPGRTRTVSGTAPLRVVIGAADAVTAQVNGREVAIPRRSGRDSARFVVLADGTLR